MAKTQSARTQNLIGLIIILVFFASIASKLNGSMWPGIPRMYNETKTYFSNRPEASRAIFTTVFDHARECHRDPMCGDVVQQELEAHLPEYDRHVEAASATYFVRLSPGGDIEKLFLDGRYETVNTEGKRLSVRQVLLGQREKLYRYGWRINQFSTTLIYLGDFPSEAEVIVPIKVDDKVVGAVVRLYGD